PPQGSFAVGMIHALEDGHSSNRISVFTYVSDYWVPGLTATFGRIDIVEPELRWFPQRRTSPFFLSTSFIYENLGADSFGGSIGLGLESHYTPWMRTSVSLAWESVFASGPADGPHWFRI